MTARNLLKGYKKKIKNLEWKNRCLTAKYRTFPSFIVIGAQKSGTSSLRGYLTQHPYVKMSFRRQAHFFDTHYSEGIDWYRSQFPIKRRKHGDMAIGESSPNYMVCPYAPARIHELLPSVKLIAILRNPRERAISHYYHSVRKNKEPLSIMEALLAEEDRISTGLMRLEKGECVLDADYTRYNYKHRGLYADQLMRFYEFFDKESILVLDSKQLFTEPKKVLFDISVFLGINPDLKNIECAPRNVGMTRDRIPDEVTDYLNDYFLPHNQRLYELIGRDFAWDK